MQEKEGIQFRFSGQNGLVRMPSKIGRSKTLVNFKVGYYFIIMWDINISKKQGGECV